MVGLSQALVAGGSRPWHFESLLMCLCVGISWDRRMGCRGRTGREDAFGSSVRRKPGRRVMQEIVTVTGPALCAVRVRMVCARPD